MQWFRTSTYTSCSSPHLFRFSAYFYRSLCLFFLAALWVGCNSDVFIDDFRTDVSELQLEADASEKVLSFRHNDWVLTGELRHSLTGSSLSPLWFEVTEASDDKGYQESFFSLSSAGTVVLNHPLIQLEMERYDNGKLKIQVIENLLPDCRLKLHLHHKDAFDEVQEIVVNIDCARYVLESSAMTLNSWGVVHREENSVLMEVVLNSDKPTPLFFYPWKDERRKVWFRDFSMAEESGSSREYFNPCYLLSSPVEVEIPTLDSRGIFFEFVGDRAPLQTTAYPLPLPNADQELKITVDQAGTTLIKREALYITYIHDTQLTFRNVKTNKLRNFHTKLCQELPDSIRIYPEASH